MIKGLIRIVDYIWNCRWEQRRWPAHAKTFFGRGDTLHLGDIDHVVTKPGYLADVLKEISRR